MIRRLASTVLATTFAIAALSLLLAGNASASGNITIGTGSTTASTGSITLRDSSLGNLIMGITLNASLSPGRFACDLSAGVTIGGVTGMRMVFSSPAGYVGTGDFSAGSWPISTRCALRSDGSLEVDVSGIRFTVVLGFLGSYVFTGDFTWSLSADGRTFTGISSSFRSNRGTTARFLTPWAFLVNPAITWTLA